MEQAVSESPESYGQEQTAVIEKKAKAQYNLSQIERSDPRLVSLVAWLLTIPGLDWNTIAKQAGMAWQTVATIAAKRVPDMQEFRHRSAQAIALVLEAAGPGLLKRAAGGKINPFEFKQLVDAWTTLSAQANVRIEHTINLTVTQAEAELMRIVDVDSTNITKGSYKNRNLTEGVGMGSQDETLKTFDALPAPASTPDPAVETGPVLSPVSGPDV